MKVTFPFEIRSSGVFGTVARPVAHVDVWSTVRDVWVEILMLVDSGADYTLLPKFYAEDLGVNLERECRAYETFGIGGSEVVYVLEQARIRLGQWEIEAPIGFLGRDNIPPLLGRQNFLENFKVVFFNHQTTFSDFRRR